MTIKFENIIEKIDKKTTKPKKSIIEQVLKTMKIAEVMDLAIMTKMVEKSVTARVRSHFSNLRFKYLNAAEIEINGTKMDMFDVISFMQHLSTFKIVFLSVDFDGFPEDGTTIKAIFECVEQHSEKLINYQMIDGKMVVKHSFLMQICLEIQESPNMEIEEILSAKFPNKSEIVRFEVCDAKTAEYPLRVLRGILNLIRPTTMELVFQGNDVEPPVLKYSKENPKFSFSTDPIVNISSPGLEKFDIYLQSMEKDSQPVAFWTISGILITFFYPKRYFPLLNQ